MTQQAAEPASQERHSEESTDERSPQVAGPSTTAEDHSTQRKEDRSETTEERIELKVFRYDPEIEGKRKPRFDEFHVLLQPGMTVLDALIDARDTFDPSLTFRHSCRHAVCGSDAVLINGRQRLACKTQVSDLEEPIRVEPLPHEEVIKDLVVDMEHFYEQMRAVEPYFQPDEVPEDDHEEQRQSRENREKIKMSTRCIWCGCCTSSCNIVAGNERFLGPAAINQGYRFAMDEREGEEMLDHRLNILEQEHGVWRCQTQFSCTTVCPKDIPLTQHIQELKREAVKRNLKFW